MCSPTLNNMTGYLIAGNARKRVVLKPKKGISRLTTDEVLARIQSQMNEVIANAQQVALSAVTSETEARAVVTGDTGEGNFFCDT